MFCHHPKKIVQDIAAGIILRYMTIVDASAKNEIQEHLANYTIKFTLDKFALLKQNDKLIEDTGSLKIGNHELVKNNKDSYIEVILRGALIITEKLYTHLAKHLD